MDISPLEEFNLIEKKELQRRGRCHWLNITQL